MAKSTDGEQSIITETNKDTKGMQEELTELKAELSMYSKEYAAATTPEQKNLLLAAMTVKETRINNLISELGTALRSGNLKYLCQFLRPLKSFDNLYLFDNFLYYYYRLCYYIHKYYRSSEINRYLPHVSSCHDVYFNSVHYCIFQYFQEHRWI